MILPLRPILSSTGSYNHECATWLSEILTPLRHHPSSLKDTFDFLDKIKNLTPGNKLMASLDVKSLFTNVPVNFTIDLILNNIFNNGVKDFNGLNRQQMKKLLTWTCKGTVFQFGGNIYEQTEGIAMGSPIAPLMADVCMNWVLNEVSSFNPKPYIILRYVDDLFCVFNCERDLEMFFDKINTIHANIQFTKELEQNNQLPYLDVLVTRTDVKFKTTVFRKKTNTGLYIKWSSLSPVKYKRNLESCLLDRAYRICNSYKAMHIEFETITDMLLRNGYPLPFIQNQIRRFLNNKHSDLNISKKVDKQATRLILRLPFIGNTSLHIEKELKSFFRRQLSGKLSLNVVHDCYKIGDMFKHKELQPKLYRHNVVYKLTCSCGSVYIGQTRRNLQSRLHEHNPATSLNQHSDVTKHLLENPNHSIDFNDPEVLCSAHNTKELLIKETLLIQQYQPDINVDGSSFPLYVFNS